MKHSQEEYWRPRFHAPPLRSHPDPPPTIIVTKQNTVYTKSAAFVLGCI